MKDPHKLKIVASDKSSFEIWLDDKQIHHVKEYELKKVEKGNLVELTLILLVKKEISSSTLCKFHKNRE